MKKQKPLYPCVDAVEKIKSANSYAQVRNRGRDDTPDFIGGKPNYEKFAGRSASCVLAWLNID